jgi:hypothetical protein
MKNTFKTPYKIIARSLFLIIVALLGVMLVLDAISQQIPPLTFQDHGRVQQFDCELRTHLDSPEVVEVYKMLTKKVDKATFLQIANKFSILPAEGKYSYTPYFGYSLKEGGTSLNVSDSGQITYHRNISIQGRTNLQIPADADVEKIATDFLIKRDLLPTDFVFASVSEGIVSVYSGDYKRVVESKQAWFQRRVDGKNVYGVSKISVEVGDQGVLNSVVILYHNIQPYGKMPLKSVKAALSDLRKGKGVVGFDVDLKPTICFIEKIELAYYEQPDVPDQTYLYPTYHVTGRVIDEHGKESKYFGVVSALKEGGVFW